MLFDNRMRPQAVYSEGIVFVVYQSSCSSKALHPHISSCDLASGRWSVETRLGLNPEEYDHHFAPVMWLDRQGFIHVLYGCHIGTGIHLVSAKPRSLAGWRQVQGIAPSMSYPQVFPLADGSLYVLYRALGHLGYWASRTSNDGGYTWSSETRLIAMNQHPRSDSDGDCWAGAYASGCAAPDGGVEIAFSYWDERLGIHPTERFHPRYRFPKRSRAKYNLYYVRHEPRSGRLRAVGGRLAPRPINRAAADEACLVLDTSYEFSGGPSVQLDKFGCPLFLLPVTGGDAARSSFHFVRLTPGGSIERATLTGTNSSWSGCVLDPAASTGHSAYVVVGTEFEESLHYGGGVIENWVSDENAREWSFVARLEPDTAYRYNNPQLITTPDGRTLPRSLIFFGWAGPGSIETRHGSERNQAQAYLWHEGKWASRF